MTNRDPDRLAKASDAAVLRDLLESGRSELPDDKQLASVLGKLDAVIGGGGGGGGGARPVSGSMPPAAAGVAGASGAKLVAAVALVAAAAWGVNSWRDRSHEKPVAIRPVVSAEIAVAAPSAPPATVETAEPEAMSPPPAPVAPSPRAAPSAPPAALASVGPAPSPRVLPSQRDSDAELDLVKQAQTALLTNPDAALALADEEARRFPDGLFREEAETIAIVALVRTGHRGPAQARAKRFRATYPNSTHLQRIDAILESP